MVVTFSLPVDFLPALVAAYDFAGLRALHAELPCACWQVERLQRKFTSIHSTLAQQQTAKAPEAPPASPLRSSIPSALASVDGALPKARLAAPSAVLSLVRPSWV
jgi:hypothetical protein